MDRQKELRNLLRSSKSTKALPSKLCGYNNKHQLICKLCKTVIKSSVFWKTHEKSTKHKETVKHLLKLKKERDSKLKNQTKSNIVASEVAKSNELQSIEHKTDDINDNDIDNNDIDNNENEEATEELIDGLPTMFFDKGMEHKRPKKKKSAQKKEKNDSVNKEANVEHFVVVDEKNNNENNSDEQNTNNMDDTEKELFKLEQEMKMEQSNKEDELLEFIKEIDKQMENEESKELKFKMDHLMQYRNTYEAYNKKRKLVKHDSDDIEVEVTNPKKKRKIDDGPESDSEFNVNDIFDLEDWRTQKI